jgi:hypothetical protein
MSSFQISTIKGRVNFLPNHRPRLGAAAGTVVSGESREEVRAGRRLPRRIEEYKGAAPALSSEESFRLHSLFVSGAPRPRRGAIYRERGACSLASDDEPRPSSLPWFDDVPFVVIARLLLHGNSAWIFFAAIFWFGRS